MKRNIIISVAAVILAAMSTACSVDETGIYGSFPYLEVEMESVSVTKVASSEAYPIKTNRKITASVACEKGAWLSAAVEGEQLVLSWIDNEQETSRVATVTLTTPNSTVTRTLNVTQDASGELTIQGDLILHSKDKIAANTYTKTKGNLIIGNVTSIVSKAASSSVSVDFSGKTLTASPTDIADADIAKLDEQIHLIEGKGLAVVNTKAETLPLNLIKANGVNKVSFDYNAMKELPSADEMKSLQLKEFSVKGNRLTDISALAECNTIGVLDISGNDVHDLAPLMKMSGLQKVTIDNLPITLPKLEVLREQAENLEIVAENVRPEDSPLPVFGTVEVTVLSDTQVQLTATVDANAAGVSKAGFYVGNKRKLNEMTWHDASYSDGVLTMTYDVETLENTVYYARAYAESSKGGDYSKVAFFGSLTSEEDVYLKSEDDLQDFYDASYSHVNGSVFVGRIYTSGSTGIKLEHGDYSMYFRSTDMSDLSTLDQLVYVRDGLYIGNVGLTKVGYISHIEGLQALWLRGNRITSIPQLAAAQTLTYLDVSMNYLENFDFLENLPAVETLKLGSSDKPHDETNDIGVIDGLAKYTNLKHIDLSGLPLHQWQVDDLKAQMPETEIVFASGGKDPHIPTVKAGRVTRSNGSVTMNATVVSRGKSAIVEYGFYYGKDAASLEQVVAGQSSINSGETFSYSVEVGDLDMYYWYPYAVNAQGETRCELSEFTLAYEDLSQTGTANSYLIQTPGKYKFNASVKGNSLMSVGNPVEAVVVWEFNNPTEWGSLISSVELKDGYVEFEIREDVSYGNALIAVKDSQGTILWSWHIWLCDFDPDASAHKTQNGLKLMDRNLGATLTTSNSHDEMRRSSGMQYYWGRKDPFNMITATHIRSYYNSVEETFAEPTYLTQSWNWLDNLSVLKDLWSPVAKTMYDPCPQGWMVADRSSWDGIEITGVTDYGITIKYDSSSNEVQYPFTPAYTPDANYMEDSWDHYIWTSVFTPDDNWDAYAFRYYNAGYDNWFGMSTGYALSVRCMKDVGFVVTTSDVKPGTDKVTAYANIKSDGLTPVSERGFVISSDNSDPNIDNARKVAAGSGAGDFSAVLDGLEAETYYWVRAYAIGDEVVRYGSVMQFITAKSGTGGDDFTEDDYVWE